MRGYAKPIPDRPNKADARATASKQLNEFKRLVKAFTKRTLHNSEDIARFQPASANSTTLTGVGILGKHPAIKMNVALSSEETQAVATSVVKINKAISHTTALEYHKGTINLEPHDLNLKGRAEWDSRLPIITKDKHHRIWNTANETLPKPLNVQFFKCPKCSTGEVCSNRGFQLSELDHNIKCFACKNISDNKDWTCACNCKWYQCHLHSNYGPAHKHQIKIQPPKEISNITQQPTAKKKARKTNKLAEYETILADDIRIATNKRELDQTFEFNNINNLVDLGTPSVLNKKPKLGPILNERFSRNL